MRSWPTLRGLGSRHAFALGALAGFALLVMSGMAGRAVAVVGANDFSEYWAISRTLLEGGDPYRPGALRELTTRYGTQLSIEPVAGQPPWTVLALLPFALLDVRTAAVAWLAFGAGVAFFGARALLRAYVPGLPLVHFGVGLALFASPSSLFTVYAGQWTLILTGALAWCVALLHERRQIPAAIATLAALAKPQLFLFAAWALVAAAVTRRLYLFLALAVGLALLVVAIPWMAEPQWWHAWRTYLPGELLPDPPRASNLPTLLFEVGGPSGLFVSAALLLAAVGVGLQFERSGDPHIAVWLALSLVAAPYTWGYDLTLLVVPIVIATGVAALGSIRRAAVVAAGGLLVLIAGALAIWSFNPTDSGSPKSLVALTVFVLVVVVLWPYRRAAAGRPEPTHGARPDGTA